VAGLNTTPSAILQDPGPTLIAYSTALHFADPTGAAGRQRATVSAELLNARQLGTSTTGRLPDLDRGLRVGSYMKITFDHKEPPELIRLRSHSLFTAQHRQLRTRLGPWRSRLPDWDHGP
jgi:hypothetical protein